VGKLITQAEAAKLRGVSISAINYLVKRKRVRSVEKFGRVLVYEDEVKNYKARPAGRPAKKATAKGKRKG